MTNLRRRTLESAMLSFLTAAALGAPRLDAQAIPAGPVVQLSPQGSSSGTQRDAGVAAVALPGGSFAVGWRAAQIFDLVRFVSSTGRAGRVVNPISGEPGSFPLQGPPVLAPGAGGGPAVAWWQSGGDGIQIWAQIYGTPLPPRTPPIRVNGAATRLLDGPLLASDPAGGFVVVWTEVKWSAATNAVYVQTYSPAGIPAGAQRRLVPNTPGEPLRALSVGIDGQGKYFLIIAEGEAGEEEIWGQRFAIGGAPLSPRREIPAGAIRMQGSGRFLLTWNDPVFGWQLARFTAEGELAAPPRPLFLPNDPNNVRLQSFTTDRSGNAAVVVRSGDQLHFILANRDQVAQMPPQVLAETALERTLEPLAAVALQETGALYAAWAGSPAVTSPSGEPHIPVRGRLFAARRDADFCVYRGSRWLCDTAGDGDFFDTETVFGLGRAAGDLPLLGDLDGDRRDDFCVVRDRRTLCDTAHDGGAAELRTPAFGQPGDLPLLGDLDGDGRDDPCRFRNGLFLCDLARDGGAAELAITFGRPNDRPVLGDVDGDGDDDPCLVRSNRFLCDTAHDGGVAERRLDLSGALGAATGTPLLGDLDGDGRDDPCGFVGNRLTCGLFGPSDSLPAAIVERPYGGSGGDPLLGDVDRF